jgi:enterochelin esterase family protein
MKLRIKASLLIMTLTGGIGLAQKTPVNVAVNKQVKLSWLGLGTREPNPFPASVAAFRAMLDKAGIKHVWYESQGTAHEWLTWRRDLFQFAQLAFK